MVDDNEDIPFRSIWEIWVSSDWKFFVPDNK